MGRARAYAALLKPDEVRRRARILRGNFLNHQFERTSPLEPLPEALSQRIYSTEIALPPRRLLGDAGSQSVDGLFFLLSLAKVMDAREVFEIGTFKGVTTWCLARNLPSATVNTLDLPLDQHPRLELEETDAPNREREPEPLAYEALDKPGTVVQHWGDSATFDFSPWRNRCDLVYIDGAHSEPYVRSDTKNAFEMLAENGAVVWDDYWRQVRGVPLVLNELRHELQVYRVPGTRLVVHLTPRLLQRLAP